MYKRIVLYSTLYIKVWLVHCIFNMGDWELEKKMFSSTFYGFDIEAWKNRAQNQNP